MAVSFISGLVAIAIFVAIFMAAGSRVSVAPVAVALPTPGQPVDTPFIYTREPAPRGPAPSPGATNPSQPSGTASENNAAPDVSVAPNPFTAGIK